MKSENIGKKKNSKIGFIHLKNVNVFIREFTNFILTTSTNKNNSYISYERRNLL